MYIAIISDLHLNPKHLDPVILKFLKKLYSHKKIERIIINGDLVELMGPPWFRYQKRFEKFYKVWASSLKPIFDSKPTTLIFGNHDKEIYYPPSLQKLISHTSNSEKLIVADHSLLITHGHQYVLKGELVYPVGLAIRILLNILYTILGFDKTNQLFGSRFNQKARSIVPSGSTLIIGHTHLFELNPFARFYNSGCNLKGQHQGLAIDTNTGKILSLQDIL